MDKFNTFDGDIRKWIESANRAWEGHRSEFGSIPNQYQRGRRTYRVPSGNGDVIPGDQKWDVTNDGTYEYTLLDVGSGVLKWDRRTLSVAW